MFKWALFVVASLVVSTACLPIQRVWFDDELANGPVPLAQALMMQPVPNREVVYEPPALFYDETCCG